MNKKNKSEKKLSDLIDIKIKKSALKNIDFSVAEEVYTKDVKTLEMYRKQKQEQGFDNTETWHLDRTFSLFIIPRLKKFMEVNNGIANGETEESYYEKMNFIVSSLEKYYSDEYDNGEIEERKKIYDNARIAVDHLSSLWFHLWW